MDFSSWAALIAFSLAVYGWGRLAFAFFHPGRAPLHAYATGLGIVTLIFFGGLLNAGKLATAVGLGVCAYGGIALAVVFLALTLRARERRSDVSSRLPGITSPSALLLLVFVLAVATFLAIELMPTQAFNFHDDFFMYMVRPVRMQMTGTIGGNPFEVLGLSDLGAQSFLQGIFLLWLPVTNITAFDTLVCFSLGILLMAEIGCSNRVTWLLVALAIAVYVVVNPQIVNLSSVYSTCVVILTLLTSAGLLVSESEKGASFAILLRYCVPVGGSLAALVALKLSSGFFVASFFIVTFGLALALRLPSAATGALGTSGAGAAALVPWLAPHIDKFDMTRWRAPASELASSTLTIHPSILEAFNSVPNLYGGTRAEYALAVFAILCSLVSGIVMLLRNPRQAQQALRIAADVGGIATYLGLAWGVNNEGALRYSCPFLIVLAASRLLFPISGDARATTARPSDRVFAPRIAVGVIAALQLGLLALFVQYFPKRVARIVTERGIVSFALNPQLRDYEAQALSDRMKSYVRGIQAKASPGSRIWAWIDAPFQLDFSRNQVWYFYHSWSVAPWRIDATTSESLRQDLVGRGVDYVLWQYRTPLNPNVPMLRAQLQTQLWVEDRIMAESALALLLALEGLATPFDTIHNDGTSILIRLRPSAQ